MKLQTGRNILGLIGSGYHSCLISTFSFDFHFFEVKVMRALRRANVRNIHLLVDAKYLDALLEFPSGTEMSGASAYSFTPIVSPSLFHPKIILLFGKKHGLLLLGSGNLTSSGYGSNDEVWSAFHVSDPHSSNAKLFAGAWNYVNGFRKGMSGLHIQKLTWMNEYSPWVHSLPAGKSEWISFGKEDIAFIANHQKNNIWQQTLSLIGPKKITDISVISPYYDSKGSWINELRQKYPSARISCVVDSEYGILPTDLDEKVAQKVNWHNWSELKSENKSFPRLHAKLVKFETKDGYEFLLMGSANASVKGMGLSSPVKVNDEACILLRSKKVDYFKLLNINLASIPKFSVEELSSHEKNVIVNEENLKSKAVYILAAELDVDEVTLLLSIGVPKACRIQMLTSENTIIEELQYSSLEIITRFKPKTLERLHFIHLLDEKGSAISNKLPVINVSLQIKSCPDPQQEKFEQAFSAFEAGEDDDFFTLLPFIQLDWANDDIAGNKQGNGIHGRKTNEENDRKYTLEEVQELSAYRVELQRAHLSSPSHKVAELLALLAKNLKFQSKNAYAESEEQKNLIDKTKEDSEKNAEEVSSKQRDSAVCEIEKKLLRKFFNSLLSNYQSRLEPIRNVKSDSKSVKQVEQSPVESRHLSNYLIALYLFMRYQGKSFTRTETIKLNALADSTGNAYLKDFAAKLGKKETDSIEKLITIAYIPITEDYEAAGCMAGFIYNIIGSFLLAIIPGFLESDYDIINKRIRQNRQEAFIRTIHIVLNFNWHELDIYFDVLTLNALLYLYPDGEFGASSEENLRKELKSVNSQATYNAKEYESNYKRFFKEILPRYRKILKTRGTSTSKNPISTLKPENLLLTKQFGICALYDKRVIPINSAGFNVYDIDLMRPGFLLDYDYEDYCLTGYRTSSSQLVV